MTRLARVVTRYSWKPYFRYHADWFRGLIFFSSLRNLSNVMENFYKEILQFFIENFPSAKALALGGPVGILWASVCLMFAGYLKSRRKWPTGYTRKVFHFLIFSTVVVVNWLWGAMGVCLFGGMTTVVLAYAIFKGSGQFMYEAIAREKDAPRRTYYIVIPYFATLIGGLASNIFFLKAAAFGYLVTGLGDALAEPVGTKFGKHQYRAPALSGVSAVRSLEGSGAVFFVSLLALTACLVFAPQFELTTRSFFVVLLIALVSTFVEAASPHGWDNTTLQVIPAWLGTLLL